MAEVSIRSCVYSGICQKFLITCDGKLISIRILSIGSFFLQTLKIWVWQSYSNIISILITFVRFHTCTH